MQGSQNGVLTLPSLSEKLGYQDNGLYLCTVSNGIMDKDGKTKQSSYCFVKTVGMSIIRLYKIHLIHNIWNHIQNRYRIMLYLCQLDHYPSKSQFWK